MAVRNFWIEADIDGRKTTLAGGPKSGKGGMDVNIYQRDEGSIVTALKIRCREADGELTMEVFNHQGEKEICFQTPR